MMSTQVADTIRPGAILGGKYRVIRPLGKGAMGKVVQAMHEELEQKVAIKLMLGPGALDPERIERFLREARAAAKLQSAHAVKVSDVGRFDGVGPYIVMEYMRGMDLDQVLTKRGPLPVPVAVDYVLEALDAVAEAHAHGIVHRDLKPSNLFLAQQSDGGAIIKVLDFGISKQLDAGKPGQHKLTGDRLSLGTPAFMAPEQLKDAKDVDLRADIWSLGVVLYELTTGQLPFKGEQASELLANVLTEEPIPLRERLPHAPAALEEVIRRCLRRERSARCLDVGELAEGIAPFGSGARTVELQRVKALVARGVPLNASGAVPITVPPPSDEKPTLAAISVAAPPRSPVALEPTQRAWGRGAFPASARRSTALAAAAGVGAALVVLGTALAVLHARTGQAERAGGEVDDFSAPASNASPTATATPNSTTAATPTPTPTATPSVSETVTPETSAALLVAPAPPLAQSTTSGPAHPPRSAAVATTPPKAVESKTKPASRDSSSRRSGPQTLNF